MKILAFADKRPHIDIDSFVKEHKPDLIVSLGDFTPEDIFGLQFIDWIPKIGVYGNHCSGMYMEELGIMNMHRKIWDFQGIRFGGFEGCVRYKDNPQAIMCTQQEATQLMQGYPPVDVFISHCPPYGINDEPDEIAHQGFVPLREYLDTQKPKVWFHGHTYPAEDQLVTQYSSTRIEYVSGYKLVSI